MTNKTVFITVCWTFSIWLAFDCGLSTGASVEAAKCRPAVTVPKKSMYDLTPRQLRRMIRYEKMRGQP